MGKNKKNSVLDEKKKKKEVDAESEVTVDSELETESEDSDSQVVNVSDDSSNETHSLLQKIESKLADKELEIKSYIDKWQRSVAEFDNYRKRTIREKSEMYDCGVFDTISKLLPVIDNFERAVSTCNVEDLNNNFYKGIEMILKQFKEILSSMDVSEIEALGNTFDPNLHNAVMHVEDENYGENEVIEDLQKGYLFKNKVIRPSMVKVAN